MTELVKTKSQFDLELTFRMPCPSSVLRGDFRTVGYTYGLASFFLGQKIRRASKDLGFALPPARPRSRCAPKARRTTILVLLSFCPSCEIHGLEPTCGQRVVRKRSLNLALQRNGSFCKRPAAWQPLNMVKMSRNGHAG